MTIRYSPAAREDLRELRRYLAGEFGAAVAEKSVRKIVTDISGDYAEFSGNAGNWRRTRNFDRFGVPTPRRIRRSAQLEPVEVADKHIKARRFSL